jgi:hypothetical protein
MIRRLLPLLALALLLGCPEPEPEPEPEPTPEPEPELPETIPVDWLRLLSGSISNRMEYVSGELEGTDCTEIFGVAGADVTDVVPDDCAQCDIVFNFFMTDPEPDCPGRDDLEAEGQLGFDLRQSAGEAVLWWFVDGWFESEWTDLGTATLTRDEEALTLDIDYEFDDPDNGSWAGNFTFEGGCTWPPCQWNGFYGLDLAIEFEWVDQE